MSQSFRQPEITEIARREGKVTIEGLAGRFGVTLQTIRRDLTDRPLPAGVAGRCRDWGAEVVTVTPAE